MTDDRYTNYGTALLRVALGVMLLAHGLLKLFVFTPAGTAAFFGSIGYPEILAYPVMFGEIAGGLALIAGFQTRLAALAATPILLGAALTHAGNGWLFSNEGGGWEFPLFWAFALVVQAMLGSGAFSIDQARLPEAATPPIAA